MASGLNKRDLSRVICEMGREMVSMTAIEAVYRSRGGDFFRLARARTGSTEGARDAVQEGFADAIRSRKSFRADGPLEAWIARCVINAAHDALQARPVGTPEEPFVDPGANGTAALVDSSVALVRQALRQLPQRQRDVLFLRFYLDFDYASIAAALGIKVGTVSATLHAARAALSRTLEEVQT
jgi:RNA polymerase sigma factor (sigma-70 family)